jgi:acid phosphatase
MRAMLRWTAILAVAAAFCSCGGINNQGGVGTITNPTPTPTPTPTPGGGNAAIGHIVLVVEENHSYSEVIGDLTNAPFMNSLATQGALATQYFANTHPSIGNYFMLTTGQLVTNDDSFTGTVDVDNIVRELNNVGKSWKSYAEGLPTVGYTGGDFGPYLKRHNPLSYFKDVVNDSNQAQRLVPFTQFAADLNNNLLPNFSFVAPNVNDDAHNGSLLAADTWLQSNIGPLLDSQQFQQDGLLIIVFDESVTTDVSHVGGHIPVILVGPSVKHGFQSTTFYQHQSTLRLILKSLGATTLPGAAANAPDMNEFFQTL